ncbi:Hypothetical predicted protein [Podarcis lilfordi]|uniref:Uncharacterized protein n=1 Tax=Podarcis lilfordi TaxID=74358 RepID=A0AA35KNM0_9SAUR|nr:Hypothetical predicted protein [Podarcis lilfordi]
MLLLPAAADSPRYLPYIGFPTPKSDKSSVPLPHKHSLCLAPSLPPSPGVLIRSSMRTEAPRRSYHWLARKEEQRKFTLERQLSAAAKQGKEIPSPNHSNKAEVK